MMNACLSEKGQSAMMNKLTVVGRYLWLCIAVFVLTTPMAFAELVNINSADANTLQSHLNGIGPVKAQAILDYRRKNGSFKSIDDLNNVPGIGEETIKNNRKNLSINKGATRSSAKRAASPKRSETSTKSKGKSKKSTKDKSALGQRDRQSGKGEMGERAKAKKAKSDKVGTKKKVKEKKAEGKKKEKGDKKSKAKKKGKKSEKKAKKTKKKASASTGKKKS